MKYVITGASGFIGQLLVPRLLAEGAQLLLIGRDPQGLHEEFPDARTGSYADLGALGHGYDALIHLAVLNNTQEASDAEYHAVNVEFMLETVAQAKQAGIGRFINVSSIQALDAGNPSGYARSKRAAIDALKTVEGIQITNLYLPLVYAQTWAGKLSFLNRLPAPLARWLFKPLAALKPTLHVQKLAAFLLKAEFPPSGDVILTDGQQNNPFYQVSRRLIDLSFALITLGLFWWLLILIWAAVRIQSPGPGIFAQQRIGQNGKLFTCYKFRTMAQGTPQAGTHEVTAAAVTSIGEFLRRTKLDELPQVWNILRNEVRLIGPRPCLPVQTELVTARKRLGVLSALPGITGLAQINDIDMSEPETLARWDARYLALQGLLLDLGITFATATGKGLTDRINTN